MDGMTLPPELERYADEAVAAGRFRDRGEVVAAGLRLLQQTDSEVAEFRQSLEDARDESESRGWLSLDEMTATMDQLLREARDPVEILRCVHTRRDLSRALPELCELPEP